MHALPSRSPTLPYNDPRERGSARSAARGRVSRGSLACNHSFSGRAKGGAYNSLRPKPEELRKQFLGNGKQSYNSGSRYAIAADASVEREANLCRSPNVDRGRLKSVSVSK